MDQCVADDTSSKLSPSGDAAALECRHHPTLMFRSAKVHEIKLIAFYLPQIHPIPRTCDK
jgi:hypothetical protein